MIDLVFVSNNTKVVLWEMTANAIRSAVEHAGVEVGSIVTVEQCRHAAEQPRGRTLRYDSPFNYNWCLNLGFAFCESRYVAFCNNDLYFERNWAKNAILAMKKHGYMSVSPSAKHVWDGVIEGYTVGIKGQLYGWCIIVDRKIFDYIGKFDEVCSFWYSDDVYAVQLRCAGIKHALVGNSRVKHLKTRTLKKVGRPKISEYTVNQKEIFETYKKQMYANSGIEIKDQRASDRRRERVRRQLDAGS
jgi:glycosyltransferase involved in cell wall biosynthesis